MHLLTINDWKNKFRSKSLRPYLCGKLKMYAYTICILEEHIQNNSYKHVRIVVSEESKVKGVQKGIRRD